MTNTTVIVSVNGEDKTFSVTKQALQPVDMPARQEVRHDPNSLRGRSNDIRRDLRAGTIDWSSIK